MNTTITAKKTKTWGDILALPEAPQGPELGFISEPRRGLEGVWKDSGRPLMRLADINDLQGLRKAIRFSQPRFGQLVADYLGRAKPYTGATVSTWELAARSRSPKVWAKYGPTEEVMGAGLRILADLVTIASHDRLKLKARLKKRGWSARLIATCGQCDKPFTPKTARAKTCPRCIAKGKK